VYQTLALLLIDVPSFAREDYSFWTVVLFLLVGFFVGYVLISLVITRVFGKSSDVNLTIAVSYLSASMLVGLVMTFFMQSGYGWVLLLSIFVVSLLPVALVLWFYLLKELENKLSLSVLHNAETKDLSGTETDKEIVISNSAGKVVFRAFSSDVISFEANDNYVMIHYLKEKEPLKQLERISLKKIEALLNKYDVNFFRVHKSFIINSEFVEEVLGVSQSYKLKLKNFNEEVPVSRQFDIDLLNIKP
jgi:hypothetical protein